MSVSPKVILITGATQGIGRHAALGLAARGHHVIATGRKDAALASLAKEKGTAGRIDTFVLDVTSDASIESAVLRVAELTAGRGLDVLINNAGYATAGPLAELGTDALKAQFETNFFGLLAVTRAFLESMFVRKHGRIVNVSSASGRIPAPMLGAYHASKYALEAASDALRMELAPFGIGVVIVEPGTIRTGFADHVMTQADATRVIHTRYAAIYTRQAELAAAFDKMAASVDTVTRALVRSVEARNPPARIVAPWRFTMAIALVRLLPTCWVDSLMQRIAGLSQINA